MREAVRAGLLSSAHDVSDGGLVCALAEAAIGGGLGCRVDLSPLIDRCASTAAEAPAGGGTEAAQFGEGTGGFVLSGERAALESLATDSVEVLLLGEVGGEAIEIAAGDRSLTLPLADAARAWRSLADRLA